MEPGGGGGGNTLTIKHTATRDRMEGGGGGGVTLGGQLGQRAGVGGSESWGSGGWNGS